MQSLFSQSSQSSSSSQSSMSSEVSQNEFDDEFGMQIEPETEEQQIRRIVSQYIFENDKSKCIFIDGPGGCGKTYLYNTIMRYCDCTNISYLCFAHTGIAASLLKNGKTLHAGFGLPLNYNNVITTSLVVGSSEYEEVRNAKVIFIDEISMVSKKTISFINKLLKDMMGNDEPFGGKIMIVGGDFRQTLPIVVSGKRADIVNESIIRSDEWSLFSRFELNECVRAGNDTEFFKWQLEIGENDRNAIIPKENLHDNVVQYVFGNINSLNTEELSKRVVLATRNDVVRMLNSEIIDKLEGEEVIYKSVDGVVEDDEGDGQIYTTEYLNKLNPSGCPPHELKLKKNTIVMLIRNINTSMGLCNGTRMIVEEMRRFTLKLRALTGPFSGKSIVIPTMRITPSDLRLPFQFKRTQFPIIPAFAMTINKSQGQSFDYVGIHLRHGVFGHGQLYVAVSRCRSKINLKFQLMTTGKEKRKSRRINMPK